MKRGTRYLVSIGLGFVVYRIAIAIVPNTTGLVISLLLGVITAFGVWALTGSKQAS